MATTCSPVEMSGAAIESAPCGIVIVSTRNCPAAWTTGICGPPNGQPLPKVMSTRKPKFLAVAAAKRIASRCSAERNVELGNPALGSSRSRGYSVAISTPPTPSAFICSNSRCNSGFVTAGPNHHHRIMIRQSSGGFAKDFSRSASSWSCCAPPLQSCTSPANRRMNIARL